MLAVIQRDGKVGSIRDFAAGRGARLLPPYWLTLAIMLALLAFAAAPRGIGGVVADGLPSFSDILINAAAMQMPARLFDSTVSIGFGINGALWMISVIVCFYLVFPLIAKPYYRHPLIGLTIAAGIAIGWREAAVHLPQVFAALDSSGAQDFFVTLNVVDQLPGWAFSFGLGMTGAWAYGRLRSGAWTVSQRAVLAGAGLAFLACCVCAYLYGERASTVSGAIGGGVARSSATLLIAYTASRGALMGAIVLGPVWMRRPFDNRALRSLAELSYAVYLIHVVIVIYVGGMVLDLPTDGSLGTVAVWFGVVLPLALAYAYLVVRFVERPARAWARRATRRHVPAGAEPAAAGG